MIITEEDKAFVKIFIPYYRLKTMESSSIQEAMVHFGMALQYTTKQIT